MPQRGSYAKGVAKREEILETALRIVAREGYGRATVKQLADAVGLSQAGLLHYFGSKEELFTEILRHRDEIDELGRRTAAERDDGPADVAGLVAELVRRSAEVPGLVHLYTRLSAEATEPDHAAHAHFRERYDRARAALADALGVLQEQGRVPADVDAGDLATMLVALWDGLQAQWLYDPSVDMAVQVRRFFDLLDRVRPVGGSAHD